MKRIYFIAVVFALSACSSQKYSNSSYQQLNNSDDAYFSPNDLKTKPKANSTSANAKESDVEKYQPQNTPYYTNTDDETANPNAANRNVNPTQYTTTGTSQSVGSNQNTANNQSNTNSNSLQLPQHTTINMYNQPNWGWGMSYSPFCPMPYTNSVTFSTWNNSWYVGPSYGAGWVYNPWSGWNYNPWAWSGQGCWGSMTPGYYYNPGYGYNNWNVYNPNPWSFNPWSNQWVYDPWGYNSYNPWGYNPYYNPSFYNNNNNYGGGNTTQVRNAPRRGSNSFMPALRTANPTGTNAGGSRVIGSTDVQAPQNNANTRNAPVQATPNPGPTAVPTRGNTNGNVGTITPSPTYNNPGRSNNNNGNAGAINPNTDVNRSIPIAPNNAPTYQPPARSPQPSVPATPPKDVFSPRNGGGNSGGGNSGGGGSTGGGGGGGRRR